MAGAPKPPPSQSLSLSGLALCLAGAPNPPPGGFSCSNQTLDKVLRVYAP
jgi:hypothetical protein